MSKSSKGEESKLDKIKHFLGIGSSKGSSLQVGSIRPQSREFFFTPELIKVTNKLQNKSEKALIVFTF